MAKNNEQAKSVRVVEDRRRRTWHRPSAGLWWAAKTGNQQFSQHGVGFTQALSGYWPAATRPSPTTRHVVAISFARRSPRPRGRRSRRRRSFISSRYDDRRPARRPVASFRIRNNHVATRSIRNHLWWSARARTTRTVRLISNKTVFTSVQLRETRLFIVFAFILCRNCRTMRTM